MSELPPCPSCQSVYTYEDRSMYVCPECAHEWSIESSAEDDADESYDDPQIKDSTGTVLSPGDTIAILKDLKVKGSTTVIKVGTKVKNIRLVDGDHNIDCKIPGFGSMKLKSEFVKKV